MIKSFSDDQNVILKSIIKLHVPKGRIDVDMTYGNGSFYREDISEPMMRFDIDPTLEGCITRDSTRLSVIPDSTITSAIFDPPFLTYVRKGRNGNGNMVMSNRFSGYWRYDELQNHYRSSLKEAARILKNKGVMIFKCQDIIHNHKMHATHLNVVNWGKDFGFRLRDLFVLTANHRMPSPNRKGTQRHARIFHCYFLVLEVGK